MLSGNGFEAGLEVAKGDLAGVTDLRESLKLVFWNVITGDNHFRDGVLLENVLYGIDCSKNRIAIHLLALVSKIIIDKADWLQSQVWIIKKLIQGIHPPPSPFLKYKSMTFSLS